MSSSECEETTNVENLDKIPLYIAPKDLLKLEEQTILDYIEKIQNLLKKRGEQIEKLEKHIKNSEHALQKFTEETKTNSYDVKKGGCAEERTVNKEDIEADEKNKEAEAFANDAFSLVDEMREAAAKAENLNNFVYEPTSGLYYDQKSGYYYNAEYGLYYDGNTGCYYSYNESKGSYEFHSQVQVKPHQSDTKSQNGEDPDEEDDQVEFDEWGGIITDKEVLRQIKVEKKRVIKKEQRRKKKGKEAKKHSKKQISKRKHNREDRDHEDGELSTSESSDSELDNANDIQNKKIKKNVDADETLSSVPVFEKSNRFQAMAKKYPPSLRIIVRESSLEKLKVGSLNLITYKGGSLGREGNHDVIIPDANVSKDHLTFVYDEKSSMYQCIDMGSRNGTLLNGHSINQTNKKKCERHSIVHGSIIQIGSTKLLCHVHEGNTTCGLCEPGLLIESTAQASTSTIPPSNLSHKKQLKVLQKKYGLENEKFVETGINSNDRNYNDRAATRRIKVGSSTDKEKTQVASVNTEISCENKGFKMLSKLGWSKGKALGKTNANNGLLEPINVVQYESKQGFGSDNQNSHISEHSMSKAEKLKIKNLHKTRERYQDIGKSADIFDDN